MRKFKHKLSSIYIRVRTFRFKIIKLFPIKRSSVYQSVLFLWNPSSKSWWIEIFLLILHTVCLNGRYPKSFFYIPGGRQQFPEFRSYSSVIPMSSNIGTPIAFSKKENEKKREWNWSESDISDIRLDDWR